MNRESSWLQKNRNKLAAGVALLGSSLGAYEVFKSPDVQKDPVTDSTPTPLSHATHDRKTPSKLTTPPDRIHNPRTDTPSESATEDYDKTHPPLNIEEKRIIETAGFKITGESISDLIATYESHSGDQLYYSLAMNKEKEDNGQYSYILKRLLPEGAEYPQSGSDAVASFQSLEDALAFAKKIAKFSDQRQLLHDAIMDEQGTKSKAAAEKYNTFIHDMYYPWLKNTGLRIVPEASLTTEINSLYE